MSEDVVQRLERTVPEFFARNWRWILVVTWLLYASVMIYARQGQIQAFALGDTDDNLRMAQVRAWLGGQGWFDLTQHRFDPAHGGANIHWSRLVDLPIAGLILLLKPFIGGADAERFAVAVAPLLPLLPLMFALSLTTKRLVHQWAWPLPIIAALFCAGSTIGMFAPLRIDHHGWQLALLGIAVAGMADPRRARGGVTLGIATGLSLSIGLEMMIYLALLGGTTVLLWVSDRDERRRLAAYAASLVATTGAGFLIFASEANRLAVCDALSPVWLTDAAVGGAAMLALAVLKLESWKARLGAAVLAGGIVAGFHVLAWPHCLERLEGVSPEATELWLSHVREARPFYRHSWRVGTYAIALPITGLIGWAVMIWRARSMGGEDGALLGRTLAVALPAVAAFALLFWQTRAAPAAQMMALPAAASLIVFVAIPWFRAPQIWKHVAAIPVFLLALGLVVPVSLPLIPSEKKTASANKVSQAGRRCPSLAALAPVNRQPKGTIFTFVDLGPRIINVTRHSAIAGPYHRNDRAIADVMKAFRGDEAQARRIITEYRSDYLLICPNMATATIFMSEAPRGFYGQLVRGRVPAWLQPVDLGKDSPYKMWRVVR
jgi:hypothetical protein